VFFFGGGCGGRGRAYSVSFGGRVRLKGRMRLGSVERGRIRDGGVGGGMQRMMGERWRKRDMQDQVLTMGFIFRLCWGMVRSKMFGQVRTGSDRALSWYVLFVLGYQSLQCMYASDT